MSRHRQARTRPRYARLLAVLASVGVTLTAALGGLGVLPTAGPGARAAAGSINATVNDPADEAAADSGASHADNARVDVRVSEPPVLEPDPTQAPAASGEGRRVVFSQADQRVWLVEDDETVERTYLVSGSVYDNLDPGTYAVFSRSEQAWGIDDSGTMKWFVRFAHGPNAAIGFHDIPVDDGAPVQTFDELGTPQSHGCIRQRTADALALWDFAPIGTTVVVI